MQTHFLNGHVVLKCDNKAVWALDIAEGHLLTGGIPVLV
jgi:hypothetical protein